MNYPYGASLEDTSMKLEYDLYYITFYSLYLDLVIVLRPGKPDKLLGDFLITGNSGLHSTQRNIYIYFWPMDANSTSHSRPSQSTESISDRLFEFETRN